MIMEMSPTIASFTGYFYQTLRQIFDAGKISERHLEKKVEKIFEEEKKKISGVYNSQGKLIEHEKSGRYLNLLV